MQVATLFREAATLLGATMEAPEGTAMKMSNYNENNMMKQEVQDDGYETSGDIDLRAQGNVPKLMGQIHQHQQSPHSPHPLQQHQHQQSPHSPHPLQQHHQQSPHPHSPHPLQHQHQQSPHSPHPLHQHQQSPHSPHLLQQHQLHQPHPSHQQHQTQESHQQHQQHDQHQHAAHEQHQQHQHQPHQHQSHEQHQSLQHQSHQGLEQHQQMRPHEQHQTHQSHESHQQHQAHQPHPHQPHMQHSQMQQHQQMHQQHPMHGHPFMHLLSHEHHPQQHPNNCIKYELSDDPYSFVDETQSHHVQGAMQQQGPKKRGRKKKIRPEDGGMMYPSTDLMMNNLPLKPKQEGAVKVYKERKKHDRFNGMPEEEVSKRTLPDHLSHNLDIVIIGINPGLFAAYKGHHYAGPGNHFWKCLYLSGLTPEPMTADDDYKLLKNGIGFTNMVERATKGSADLTRKEIKEGSQVLLEKLQKFKPKIAVFNGKLIFEVFSGKKDFCFGRQPELVDGTNTYMWVMPSSSARCAQLPRAADKVPFYSALKKFRDYLNGVGPELDENEIVFTYSKLKTFFEPEVKEEPKDGMYYNEFNQLENNVVNEEGEGEPLKKKKRGRPKKIKNENGEEIKKEPTPKPPKPVVEEDKISIDGVPKKKRGRPKKIKTNLVIENGMNNSEHSNPSTHLSNCFSPPIQSPMNLPPMYPSQPPTLPSLMNQPSSQSPLVYQPYSQSPQAPSFTHSDLSSEISAAISSENIHSPGPTSPSLGPPEFEPPASMPEEPSKSPPPSTPNTISEENRMECHFSSPTPAKDKTPEMNYQNYEDFSAESDSMTTVRYPHAQRPRMDYQHIVKPQISQDVASKSLSGLESLVDQIPNIGEGEQMSEHVPSGQFSDESYLSEYSRMYPPPSTPTAPPTTQQSQASMNFSVSSLTNNSSIDAFSVSHNYNPSSYPNLMGPPHPHLMDSSSSSLFNPLVDRTCRLGGSSMNSVGMPYPYNQYSSPGFSYPAPHNIHVPSPSFPYGAPYPSAGYSQTGYHNIGYGSF
ncbi:unnamed protein product [Bemisia tabaci]|uniref:G/T mismatch-specific thymine DNA glycosylase n=2 Tax=Bemisia tabaci TaxID=7038 RepID=A0A9P0F1L1_BEMTA|nr:unnamed protein product [Bemisia tabaci]